jgi:hypothetical protein
VNHQFQGRSRPQLSEGFDEQMDALVRINLSKVADAKGVIWPTDI